MISVDCQRVDGKLVYDKAKFKQMVGFIKLSKFWELWQGESNSIGWRDGKFVLYGDGWKWYPDFEDVKAFHEMFNALSDIEGISGYFLRVGEERDDVEEDHFGDDPDWDMFYAQTFMTFDGGHYLGERFTDDKDMDNEEEQNTQGEPDLPTPTSQGDEKATPAT